jgi:hypothetical protein
MFLCDVLPALKGRAKLISRYAARNQPLRGKELAASPQGVEMEIFWQDVRYGLRMLLKAPSFSIVATIALALGIGANTAIFSVVNAVLLRPLPFPNSEQLMMVWENDKTRGQQRGSASYPNFADWRDQNHVFEHMASFHNNDFILTGRGESSRLQGSVVNAHLFP